MVLRLLVSQSGLLFDECWALSVPCGMVILSSVFLAGGASEFGSRSSTFSSRVFSGTVRAGFIGLAVCRRVACPDELAFEASFRVLFKLPGVMS